MITGAAVSTSEPERIALAYDAVAPDYDRLVAADAWMRRVLWRRYLQAFASGDHVIDLGCGTGTDALFLARHGIRVTAIDISPGMVAELRRKAAAEGRTSLIATQVGEIARLDGEPESVRGIVSAFAALNTVADLDDFAARAHRLLRSRGRLILHMLSPAGVRRGGQPPAHADERDDPDTGQPPARRTRQIDVCGQPIPHRMATAREVYRGAFAGRFALRRVWALGFLCPSRVTRRLPAWLAHLQGRLETGVGRWRPFVDLGRFYVLDMEKREAPASEERRR